MNNASFGMTLQKYICDVYNLTPCDFALNEFVSNYDVAYLDVCKKICEKLFDQIKAYPVECLTYKEEVTNTTKTRSPHNFRLSDGKTLSIRTNKKGSKVSPRIVGQCGIETFNDFFEAITGVKVKNQQDIKYVIYNNIDVMLPVFVDYLLCSDLTVWITLEKPLDFMTFNNSDLVDIDFEKNNFKFTRKLNDWTNSITIKYKNISIAEAQLIKGRNLIFRFIMDNFAKLIKEQKYNNETLGISAEKAVCDVFGLPYPESFNKRSSREYTLSLRPIVIDAFKKLPKPIKHTGSEKGLDYSTASKCPYDFVLEGNKRLSLKTNTSDRICPPDVGQPSPKTCYKFFGDLTNKDYLDEEGFKEMVLNNIEKMMPVYVSHLFDSEYLLWIVNSNGKFTYEIFNQQYAKDFEWNKNLFSFTKNTVKDWNVSTTVKYKGISIGEFEVHKTRSCYKFRFNMNNFEKLINEN